MRLEHLIEQMGAERWSKLMGTADPVNIQLQQRQQQTRGTRRHKVAEFYLRFEPEHGGGYYKVRAKRVEKKGNLYNYGYFDRPNLPDLAEISPHHLTDEGKEDYRKLQVFIRQHQHTDRGPQQGTTAETDAERESRGDEPIM